MGLVSGKEVLERAYRGGYAIGAFNGTNIEITRAIVEAAEEESAPVFLQLSMGILDYLGFEIGVGMAMAAASSAKVPVVLHLDHGRNLEQCVLCLRNGFTSIMYDGTEKLLEEIRAKEGSKGPDSDTLIKAINSREALERNISETRRIAEIVHACEIPLEAELGRIPRDSDFHAAGYEFDNRTGRLTPEAKSFLESLYVVPDFAEEFVEETGCDSLAIACGSIHGMLAPLRPLNIRRIEEIASRVDIPLVLHGTSGVLQKIEDAEKFDLVLEKDEGSIQEAISAGIAKINVSTDLQKVFLKSVEENFPEKDSGGNLRKIFAGAREKLKDRIRFYIRLFGSSGKA